MVSKTARRRETLDTWQARWDVPDKGRETYQWFPSIRAGLLIKDDWDHYAAQYLSGHFAAKLHGFTLKEDPWCQICGHCVEDTVWHTLAGCPDYNDEREEIRALLTDDPEADKKTLVTKEISEFSLKLHIQLEGKKRARVVTRDEEWKIGFADPYWAAGQLW